MMGHHIIGKNISPFFKNIVEHDHVPYNEEENKISALIKSEKEKSFLLFKVLKIPNYFSEEEYDCINFF
jgi:hypothetical protein